MWLKRFAARAPLPNQSCYVIRSYVAAARAELKVPSGNAWPRRAEFDAARQHRNVTLRREFATSRGAEEFQDSPAFTEADSFDALEDEFATMPEHDAGVSPSLDTKEEASRFRPPSDQTRSDLPWYLRPDISPPPPRSPLSDQQRLPDLPPSPPPVLAPLLAHLSDALGMDSISLLDLRGLSPPSALGSNLLMLVGTARSAKHLHVSADRLCRWLRTEHRLRPFADGLLGRREVKLAAKRRAKRVKLMRGAVGAKSTATGEIDEGLRTGWVCVNVGMVEGGVLEGVNEVDEDFVGFREETKGCRIVIQLMTEEKRGELDLESLWTGILGRSLRDNGNEDVVAEGQEEGRHHPSPFPEAQTITVIEGRTDAPKAHA